MYVVQTGNGLSSVGFDGFAILPATHIKGVVAIGDGTAIPIDGAGPGAFVMTADGSGNNGIGTVHGTAFATGNATEQLPPVVAVVVF